MNLMEYQRDGYTISNDPARLDLERLHALLLTTYWANKRTFETVQRSVAHSLNFGVYTGGELVGFARVVTDTVTFAWLCDVVIDPAHRNNGLGKWLIECVTAHPDIEPLRRLLLATQDAHGLYEKYGFKPLAHPERWMEKFNPEVG